MWLRALRRALLILTVAGVLIAGILVIAQDQSTIRIRSDISAEDPRDPAYVAALAGTALTRGNRYDVLTNGDQIFPAMLEAIDSARKRINFETYVYDAGHVADRFSEGLERAARRGVKVIVLVDAIGGSPMEAEHQKRLESAGARVLTFNSPWYRPESVNFRTHRKILVVDGDIGFTGGAGVADHWLGNAQDKDHWRDTQVRIRGPIVRLLEASFYENALESHGPIVPEFEDRPESAPSEDDEASMIVRSSSSGGSTDLKRLYLQALASARRTVDITSPYFVTDESTLWSLEDARRRNVQIRVLVEGDVTDAPPVKYASREVYDQLLSWGIEIHEYQPTMMHVKTIVVDGILSIFGSANFDNRSLELNDELNVAVWSRGLAARLTEDFEKDLRSSNKLELETWRQRSLLMKFREHLWSYFGELF